MSAIFMDAIRNREIVDEAKVQAVIELVDAGMIVHHTTRTNFGITRYDRIQAACEFLQVQDVAYWMDEWFKIPKEGKGVGPTVNR